MSERLDYHELVEGRIPPWVMRFIKSVGKTINEYGMVKAGDEVLLAVSGGKDSLALALALSLRLKWLPVDYSLSALMIDWREHPIPDEAKERLKEYFSALSIDFTIQQAPQFPPSFDGDFNCYLCSRNRRRILFEEADRRGVKLIAMGHHLDDLVETSLMNLCFRADFNSMRPVQDFFNGKMHIIRPMIEVHESVTRRLSEVYDLPTVKPVCPYDQTNIRARLKPIVGQLCHIDGLTREHIYKAHHFDCALK
ncbi:MAG: adenine nucleotide alpha hydrolase [Spirochaetes bacterium]|uniref:Adenine nucleotide alpha hydrolase n=1 Tax=Candidatus Aphodenecus pullistercoris TaxID=2840669 RepID=A0A9D9EC93_9SPIR|nr:adenine nucleotide alpha hydrolase [Candidatus Aphodenecus pullistercoris]